MRVKYQQLYTNECGKYSIKNLLYLYKYKDDIEITYNEQGTSLKDMIIVLKRYFYDVNCVSFNINELKKVKHFEPFISLLIKDDMSHYVVVYKVDKKYIYILDSNVKKSYRLIYKKYEELCSNIAIVPSKYKRVNYSILKYKKLMIIPLISLLEAILSMSTTMLIKEVIDNGLNNAFIYIGVQLILLVLTSYKVKMFLKIFKSIDYDIVFQTMNTSFNLKTSFVKKHDLNELYYRVSDSYYLKGMYLLSIFSLCNDALLFLCSIVLMFLYSYIIGSITVFICFLLYFFIRKILKKTCKILEEKRESEYEFINHYKDNFLSFYNEKKEQIKKDDSLKSLKKYQKCDYELERLNNIKNLTLLYVQSFLIMALVIVYFTSLYNYISIGSLVALINLITLVLQPFLNICSEITKLSNYKLIYKRLNELNDNVL